MFSRLWRRRSAPSAPAPEIPASTAHIAQPGQQSNTAYMHMVNETSKLLRPAATTEAEPDGSVTPVVLDGAQPPSPPYVPPTNTTQQAIKTALVDGKDAVELAPGGRGFCTAHHGGSGGRDGYVLDVHQFHTPGELAHYLRNTSLWQGRNCLDWCDDPDPLVRVLYRAELQQTGEAERQRLYARGGIALVRTTVLQRARETLARSRQQQEAAAHPWRTWFRRRLPLFFTEE